MNMFAGGARRPARRIRARGQVRHKTGRMNKTEASYALFLEACLASGLIQWYDFEAVQLRLADDNRYTPDFLVVASDGTLELHEVKAFWKNKGGAGWKEDARLKCKFAAEHFPFVMKGVYQDPSGEWKIEIF